MYHVYLETTLGLEDNSLVYFFIDDSLYLAIYIYIYIYIYINCHPWTNCFVVSKLISVVRHAGRFKLESKPTQLYVRLSIILLSQGSAYARSGIMRHQVVALACSHFALPDTGVLYSYEELCITEVPAVNSFARVLSPRGKCIYMPSSLSHYDYNYITLSYIFSYLYIYTHIYTPIYIYIYSISTFIIQAALIFWRLLDRFKEHVKRDCEQFWYDFSFRFLAHTHCKPLRQRWHHKIIRYNIVRTLLRCCVRDIFSLPNFRKCI